MVEALLALARPDGACYAGNDRLVWEATRAGDAAAAACGFRRYRGSWRSLGRFYFRRVLQRLVLRGIVSRTWFLSARLRWVRALRVSESALRAYAQWGEDHGRRWRWGRDPIPVPWDDRASSFPHIRRMRARGREHVRQPEAWRSMVRQEAGR